MISQAEFCNFFQQEGIVLLNFKAQKVRENLRRDKGAKKIIRKVFEKNGKALEEKRKEY